MDSNRVNLLYQEPFDIYFGYNFEYPKELREVIVMKPEDSDFNYYLNRHFRDFLSRGNNNRLINYIPLYNPDNFKREAYIILSTGIDGGIDNILNENDTVYISDFKERLNLYNPSSFSKTGDTLRPYYYYNYNIISYFFGKKDYLRAPRKTTFFGAVV